MRAWDRNQTKWGIRFNPSIAAATPQAALFRLVAGAPAEVSTRQFFATLTQVKKTANRIILLGGWNPTRSVSHLTYLWMVTLGTKAPTSRL